MSNSKVVFGMKVLVGLLVLANIAVGMTLYGSPF